MESGTIIPLITDKLKETPVGPVSLIIFNFRVERVKTILNTTNSITEKCTNLCGPKSS